MTNKRQRKKKLKLLRLRERLEGLQDAVVEKVVEAADKVVEEAKVSVKEEKEKKKLSFADKLRKAKAKDEE